MNVRGRVYGPFSLESLKAFAAEGRLAGASLVCRDGTSEWRAASDDPELSALLPSQPKPPPSAGAAESVPKTKPMHVPAAAAQLAPEVAEGKQAHFTIVIDVKARPSSSFDQAVSALGTGCRLLPNLWILATTQSVNTVRNRLLQELGRDDALFVVDASRGKAAWFNFGAETDARIRRVWQKAS